MTRVSKSAQILSKGTENMRIFIYIYDNTDKYICIYVEKITLIYRCMTRVFKGAQKLSRGPENMIILTLIYDNT